MGSSILPTIATVILDSKDIPYVKQKIKAYARTVNDINELTLNIFDEQMNLLHFAVAIRNESRDEIVTFLTDDLKMDVNRAYGEHNWTPSHIAACYGHHTTLKKLLKAGADPYIADAGGNLVSDVASAYDQPLCIDTIERHCRCPDDTIVIDDDDYEPEIPYDVKPIISTFEKDGHRFTITKDPYFNVTLVEDTLMTSDDSSTNDLYTTASNSSNDSQVTVIRSSPFKNSIESMSDDELRKRLITYGESPVPVVDSTRDLLRKRLRHHEFSAMKTSNNFIINSFNNDSDFTTNTARSNVTFDIKDDESGRHTPKKSLLFDFSNQTMSPSKHLLLPGYSPELNLFAGWLKMNLKEREVHMQKARDYYEKLIEYYSLKGTSPSYFNYLLIDPRDLKYNQDASFSLIFAQQPLKFEEFIKAIFYIGKGAAARPLAHLYEAAREYTKQKNLANNGSGSILNKLKPPNAKVSRILDIWKQGMGVISIPVFHNRTSDEALARESFMIEAIGLKNLTNIQTGQKKGKLLEMTKREKTILGSFLLYKSFLTFLVDRNTQIKNEDLRD